MKMMPLNLPDTEIELDYEPVPDPIMDSVIGKRNGPDVGDCAIFRNQFREMFAQTFPGLEPSETPEDCVWLIEEKLDLIRGWIGCLVECEGWTFEQENWLVHNIMVPIVHMFPHLKLADRGLVL